MAVFRRVDVGDKDFHFGDIVEAPWLFDVYVRPTAAALVPSDSSDGRIYKALPHDARRKLDKDGNPVDRARDKDLVLASSGDETLAFGDVHRALILSDDCEIYSAAVDKKRRRLRLAVVRPIRPAEEPTLKKSNAFHYFYLPADGVFEGGVVELWRSFLVHAPELLEATRAYAFVDSAELTRLKRRWCAQATRHGPEVAVDGADKLARLITAAGDPVRAELMKDKNNDPDAGPIEALKPLITVLEDAWKLEGDQFDEIAQALEEGRPHQASVKQVIDRLEKIGGRVDLAIDQLKPFLE